MHFSFDRILRGSGLFLLVISAPALSYFNSAPPEKRQGAMNEIRFSDVKDFMKNWYFVTVRYRQDTNEMRFVYANEIAWKALQSLKPDYPDGAAFGKIGLATESDPAFLSSKMPSTTRRYQFMVKDKKKYRATDGWGYALFDGSGFQFDEDTKLATQACAACHRIVPQRDFVFSRIAALAPQDKSRPMSQGTLGHLGLFKELNVGSLPIQLAKQVTADGGSLFTSVDSLEGEIKQKSFSGTLDEVVPLLLDQAHKNHRPSVMVLDTGNFSVVIPLSKTKGTCPPDQSLAHIVVQFNAKKVRDAETCN